MDRCAPEDELVNSYLIGGTYVLMLRAVGFLELMVIHSFSVVYHGVKIMVLAFFSSIMKLKISILIPFPL